MRGAATLQLHNKEVSKEVKFIFYNTFLEQMSHNPFQSKTKARQKYKIQKRNKIEITKKKGWSKLGLETCFKVHRAPKHRNQNLQVQSRLVQSLDRKAANNPWSEDFQDLQVMQGCSSSLTYAGFWPCRSLKVNLELARVKISMLTCIIYPRGCTV